MRIAFYGSSLLSAYWNGAATYYRGILSGLARLGYGITFYEPDAFDRQAHRDIDPPDWARVVVYPATADGLRWVMDAAREADIVVKASGVGVFDEELLGIFAKASPLALKIFWDVNAPATLATLKAEPRHPLRLVLGELATVFTYGGGPPVVCDYEALGAVACVPIYNALDPETHFPAKPDPRFAGSLSFLGNRLPDRERRVEEFFIRPAELLPQHVFPLGGAGWEDKGLPPNIRRVGHVSTREHNAFNCSALALLNIARDSMAENGFSPATRVFEAAGAGACLITDQWEGIEMFLAPGEEVLVARDGQDVAAHLAGLSREKARAIGEAARRRVLAEHTYQRRAAEVDAILRRLTARTPARRVA